ncbi:restriction endonuclease subunit S [Streptococcus uberis]|uniref:restriction endonuclease subunit S n=1 Tax=Streptococcus uberis TaxID=1349 RepID=UPI003D779A02
MDKIEKLIKELCPNGVERHKLGDICDTVTDFTAAGSFASNAKNVKYKSEPDFAQLVRTTDLKSKFSNTKFVYVDEHAFNYLYRVNINEESIILPNVGNCGEVYYVMPKDLPYAKNVLGPNALLVRSSTQNNRFLYHLFQERDFQRELGNITSNTGQSKFNKTNLKKIVIPIPPLKIQEEIVKILDKFTDYVTELTTELTLRQKQYHYYREKLFTFEEEVKKINLSELSHYIKSGKNSVRNIVGNYPVYASTGQIGFSDSYEYNHSQILVARVGAYAGKVYTATGKYDVTDNTLMISVDNNKINFQYLYYYLVNFGLNKLAKGAGQPLITGKQLKELKVPVPSIESQKEIVMFLDKLDIVSNDLNAGLPKEIELRQKQYEFYRDKLLSFD